MARVMIRLGEQTSGPYTATQIDENLRAGADPAVLVQVNGRGTWVPAGSVNWNVLVREEVSPEFGQSPGDLGCLASVGLLAVSAAIVLWQAYSWARFGAWPGVSPLSLCDGQSPVTRWLLYPTDWIGIASVARWFMGLPMSLWLVAAGVGIGGVTAIRNQ